jgi:hypothetical protein
MPRCLALISTFIDADLGHSLNNKVERKQDVRSTSHLVLDNHPGKP